MRRVNFVVILGLVSLLAATVQRAAAQGKPEAATEYFKQDSRFNLTATSEIAAELSTSTGTERITGRISFHIITSPDGKAVVRGFNVVLFGVSQKLLAGKVQVKDPLGMLGFAVVTGKPQTLAYDARTGKLSGELRMFGDASYLSTLARPMQDGPRDLYETPTLPAIAAINLQIESPLERGKEVARAVSARLELNVRTEATKYQDYDFPNINVRATEFSPIKVNITPYLLFEIGHTLCVQPVRLLNLSIEWNGWFPVIQFQESGDGLPFGEPGARTQWGKADVVFDIRNWKALWAGSDWVMDATEADGLRSQVNDGDCIEVFFVHDFSPEDMWGGGATFGSGTASAQIITSDANARYGVDLTHLAHELGHVLGLLHPGSSPTASAVAASTGTLMCPSGFRRDNPRVNSKDNAISISNPLLTFTLKLIGPGPDCLHSADCGPCP